MSEWMIELRDDTFTRIGQLDGWTALDMILRFNDVGTWALRLPIDHALASELALKKAGIVVTRDDEVILSGPIGRKVKSWGDRGKVIDISGFDDKRCLAERLALPDPDGDFASQAHDIRTGAAETVLKEYVDYNAGPSAVVDRRVPGLVIEADAALGATVTGRARFQNLLDLLTNLALAGGDLGFKVVQDGSDIEFRVYQPTDKSAEIIFSQALGNVLAYDHDEVAPTANYVYAGAAGELTSRLFREAFDTDSVDLYGRIESFRDARDTDDPDEVDQRLEQTLQETAYQETLKIDPTDTARMRFFDDYYLGDIVTAIADGKQIQQVVREVNVNISERGVVFKPLLATPGPASAPAGQKITIKVSDIESRVEDLERRL